MFCLNGITLQQGNFREQLQSSLGELPGTSIPQRPSCHLVPLPFVPEVRDQPGLKDLSTWAQEELYLSWKAIHTNSFLGLNTRVVDTSGIIPSSPWKGRLNGTTKIFTFLRKESASKNRMQPWRNRSHLKTLKQHPPNCTQRKRVAPGEGITEPSQADNQTTVSKAPVQSLGPFKEVVSKRCFNYLQIRF